MTEVFIVKVIIEHEHYAPGHPTHIIYKYLDGEGVPHYRPTTLGTWMEARKAIKDSALPKEAIFEIVSAYQKTGE